jgi:hypothetical protein
VSKLGIFQLYFDKGALFSKTRLDLLYYGKAGGQIAEKFSGSNLSVENLQFFQKSDKPEINLVGAVF